MARVLAYTSPARGHLFPITPVLDELRARGHQVALRTLGSQVELMRARGFDAAPVDPQIERMAHDDYRGRTPLQAQKRSLRVLCRRAEFEVGDLRRALDEVEPDLVLADIGTWGAMAAAEAWGGRWATWCPYPLPIPSQDAPPFGPGLAPARGLPGRLRDTALRPVMFGALERLVRPRINEIRDGIGLPPIAGAKDMFAAPDLLLYMTAEPFEYPRSDWPANVRLIGPCDWDPPQDPPEWLDEIAGPIVLVTTSSEFQDDGRLVRTAIEALADEPVHVIATLPSGDPATYDVPPNATVVAFAPHGHILDRAAAAITHGGMGATQKALAARRAGVRSPVRARPVRGRPPGRARRRGNPAAGQAAEPRATARSGHTRDALPRRRPPHRRRVPHRRRGRARRRRAVPDDAQRRQVAGARATR